MFKCLFVFLAILLFGTSHVLASQNSSQTSPIIIRPKDFNDGLRMLRQRVDVRALKKFAPRMDLNDHALTFISRQALLVKNGDEDPFTMVPEEDRDEFVLRTQFLLKSKTIEKRVSFNQGAAQSARMRFYYLTDAPMENFLSRDLGFPIQVYNSPNEMFFFAQLPNKDKGVDVKEWVYARRPNCPQGTCLRWKVMTEEFERRLVLEPDANGSVSMQRQIIVKNIDPTDYQRQRHIISQIHKVLKDVKFHINGEDKLGEIEPVFYIDKEGKRKQAKMGVSNLNELIIEIHEPAKNYPIFIES